MKKIVHRSVIPLYVVAATWLLYALRLPLYQPAHYITAVLVTAAVGGVARLLCPNTVEEVELPKEPETTGNAELDKMIDDCSKAIIEMKRLDINIEDPAISAQIVRLEELTGKIMAQIKKDPSKLPQIRKFLNYYLPTTLKLLNSYDLMSAQGVEGENISTTITKVKNIMATIVTAFEKQLDSLFGSEALDISTDITVLENMMAREGLTDDALHQAAAAAAAAKVTVPPAQKDENTVETTSGITLEL